MAKNPVDQINQGAASQNPPQGQHIQSHQQQFHNQVPMPQMNYAAPPMNFMPMQYGVPQMPPQPIYNANYGPHTQYHGPYSVPYQNLPLQPPPVTNPAPIQPKPAKDPNKKKLATLSCPRTKQIVSWENFEKDKKNETSKTDPAVAVVTTTNTNSESARKLLLHVIDAPNEGSDDANKNGEVGRKAKEASTAANEKPAAKELAVDDKKAIEKATNDKSAFKDNVVAAIKDDKANTACIATGIVDEVKVAAKEPKKEEVPRRDAAIEVSATKETSAAKEATLNEVVSSQKVENNEVSVKDAPSNEKTLQNKQVDKVATQDQADNESEVKKLPNSESDVAKDEASSTDTETSSDKLQSQETDKQVLEPEFPEQYSPITNPNGKRKYSKRFLLEVSLKVCKLNDYEREDKGLRDTSRVGLIPSEKVDYFAPTFSNNQRYSNLNRQNDPRRANHIVNRANVSVEKPRKILPVVIQTEVELKTAANPWKPVDKKPSDDADASVIKRKFRGILNKLTPQNFDSLSTAVKALKIEAGPVLEEVIDIVFAKALAEPGFCELYGKICNVLKNCTGEKTAGANYFYTVLLKRCQIQFQSDIYAGLDITGRQEAVNAEEDPEKKKLMEEELFEDMFKCRQRGLGLIKFIGELYKINMLNKDIMFECIHRLSNDWSEESLECLCDLLATVGKKLDEQCSSKEDKKFAKPATKTKSNHSNQIGYAAAAASTPNKVAELVQAQLSLDTVFDTIHKIRKSKESDLSSRIKFKLLDTCDLREKQRWKPRKALKENNLQKIDDIHKEAHEKKLEQERKYAKTRQDGRKVFGHSGSSNQISSMTDEPRRLPTSASSHMLRDNSTMDNSRANQSEVEKEHASNKEKMKAFSGFSNSTLGEDMSKGPGLRPKFQVLSLSKGKKT